MRPVQAHIRRGTERAAVTPLELFFDLVFVFALTQVTAFMAAEVSTESVVRGLLVVLLLWWAWTGYAWISNLVSAEEPAVRPVLLVAMTAMFVLALCIPEAFTDAPGGLDGPTVLALTYLVFRVLHLVVFWLLASGDTGLRRQLLRFVPSVAGSTLILLVAAQFAGTTQTVLWVGALVVDYLGTALGGAGGWRLPAPGHFAERHGLIVIVALGESIVAIGVGVADRPISWPIIIASALGLLLAAAMWWAYFDLSALQAEHALSTEPVATRPRLGRNAYSFAHLPLIASVVLVALGLKKVLEYVSDVDHHTLADPLKGAALFALVGGAALYLLAEVLFLYVSVHRVSAFRLVAAGVLLSVLPVGSVLPALAQLGTVALVVTAALAAEATFTAERRHRIRAELSAH